MALLGILPQRRREHAACRAARKLGSRRLVRYAALGLLALSLEGISTPGSVAAATAASRQTLIDHAVGASVKIVVERNGRRVASASGVVIATQPPGIGTEAASYVLTVSHALAGAESATVFVGFCGQDATRGKVPATVVSRGASGAADLALLRVPGVSARSAGLPEGDYVQLGRPILVVGFPEGERLGISGGIISQLPLAAVQNGIPADRADPRLVIDADAARGMSGGGVFDAETGALLGIVQGHQTFSVGVKDQTQHYSLTFPVPGSTFVVPVSQIRPFLASTDALD